MVVLIKKKFFFKYRFKKIVMTNTRATWNNKADFILALFSYGVGLGNVWRYEFYLIYKQMHV